MIVKIIILRLLGSSDDKEREDRRSKTGRAAPTRVSGQRPESSSIQEHRKNRRQGHRCIRRLSEEPTLQCLVQEEIKAKSAYKHWLNRRSKKGHRCIGSPLYQRRCQVPRGSFFSTGSTDGASVHTTGVMTSASMRRFLQHRLNR